MTVKRFETDEADPFRRGVELGRFGSADIARNVESYAELFRVVGVDPDGFQGIGEASIARITAWAPDLAEELRGVAEGSGIELWNLGMLNARTEVLATVGAIGEGECSTVVVLDGDTAPRSVQTWDWHDVSNEDTLVVSYPSHAGHTVRYFTEFGILGKIGVNDAGIGVHFNILNHRGDGGDIGVPVHAVARAVLDRATTLEEGIALASSAAVSASTVLTIVSYAGGRPAAVSVELSPVGAAVVPPLDDGFLVHTNHFLDPDLAVGEMLLPASSSYPRLRMLRDRRERLSARDPLDRAVAMLIHQSDGAPVCCHPDADLAFEHRWETLLTIALDVERGLLEFHEGGPCTATAESWQRF